MASTSILVYIGGHRHRRGILFGDAYPEEGVRQQATAAWGPAVVMCPGIPVSG